MKTTKPLDIKRSDSSDKTDKPKTEGDDEEAVYDVLIPRVITHITGNSSRGDGSGIDYVYVKCSRISNSKSSHSSKIYCKLVHHSSLTLFRKRILLLRKQGKFPSHEKSDTRALFSHHQSILINFINYLIVQVTWEKKPSNCLIFCQQMKLFYRSFQVSKYVVH